MLVSLWRIIFGLVIALQIMEGCPQFPILMGIRLSENTR